MIKYDLKNFDLSERTSIAKTRYVFHEYNSWLDNSITTTRDENKPNSAVIDDRLSDRLMNASVIRIRIQVASRGLGWY